MTPFLLLSAFVTLSLPELVGPAAEPDPCLLAFEALGRAVPQVDTATPFDQALARHTNILLRRSTTTGKPSTTVDLRPCLSYYAKDLQTGEQYGSGADTRIYMTSTYHIVLLVAIYREIESRRLSLDEQLPLSDVVLLDGSPILESRRLGETFPVADLIGFMMRDDDQTAADMLYYRVGYEAVNDVASALGFRDHGLVLSNADQRKYQWSALHRGAWGLDADHLRALQKTIPLEARLELFAQLTGTPLDRVTAGDYFTANQSFVLSGGVNMSTPRDLGRLLEQLSLGQIVSPQASREILNWMLPSQTAEGRVLAGLPVGARFFHKSGIHAPVMADAGLVIGPRGRRYIVVGYVDGFEEVGDGVAVLKNLGQALSQYVMASSPR